MRESQVKKVPITFILGDKEVNEEKVSFRVFGSQETLTMTFDEFITYLKENHEK